MGFELYDVTLNRPLDASNEKRVSKTFAPRDVALSDLHVGRIMESDLATAERKARWNKDFDAKGHIRQT